MDTQHILDGYRNDFFRVSKREDGTITGIAATETPVSMPNFSKKGFPMEPEALIMDGVSLPDNRKLPLLDTHDRSSVDRIKGSIVNLRVENGELIGDLEISKSQEGVKTLVDEGHLDSLSVGYRILERRVIPAGQTEVINGRTYEGGTNLITRWVPKEVSLVAIGADTLARIRAEFERSCIDTDIPNIEEKPVMTETKEIVSPVEERKETAPAVTNPEPNELETAERELEAVSKDIQNRNDVADKIRTLAKRFNLSNHADELAKCKSITEAKNRMLDLLAGEQKPIEKVVFGKSDTEKRTAAIEAGLARRIMSLDHFERAYKAEDRQNGYEEFRGRSISDIARACLGMQGERDADRLSNERAIHIAMAPMQSHEWLARRDGSTGQAYNTSGTFPNLLLNVVNKELLQGYELAPSTYQIVGRIGPSVKDFKPFYGMRIAEVPFLDAWTDDSLPNEVKGNDKYEKTGIDAYSKIVSLSYQSMINDDLDAFAKYPAQLGESARATVNYIFWKKFIDNANTSDSNAFFGSSHANDITSGNGNTPSNSQLNTMRQKMMTQKGLTSTVVLAARPKYLVVPAALDLQAKQLVRSAFDPAATTSVNVYAYNPSGELEAVTEPLLDVFGDTHTYYLFGANTSLTTAEVRFLEGQEQPVVKQWLAVDGSWSMKIQAIQSFAVLLLDWQNAVRNAGQ